MNKNDFLKIAKEQSAIDQSCFSEDFDGDGVKVVISKKNEKARKYLKLPHICSIVSYGGSVVASVEKEEYVNAVNEYLNKYDKAHLFETPNIYALNGIFEPYGAEACFMAEFFLPDGITEEPPIKYKTKWLPREDFKDLYLPEWSNALCERRKELDILGLGAFDGEKLAALSACSADCENMWQIGIDVLEEYRGQGLSTALTVRLKNEIIKRGKVPFYSAAWSNIRSVRNAVSSGFKPAWVEIAVKSKDFCDDMIK